MNLLEVVTPGSNCQKIRDDRHRRFSHLQDNLSFLEELLSVRTAIDVVYDASNPLYKGSSLVLWAKTDTRTLLGGDAIGELRKSSEEVGKEAATNLLVELEAKATVDVHLADMLVPYVALAEGESVYLTRSMTEHLDTNLWLTRHILGTEFHIEKTEGLHRIQSKGN